MFEIVTAEVSQARIDEFNTLYKKWRAGVRWINEQIAAWTGAREYMPRIEGHIKEFRTTVEEPMDRLWLSMTEEERDNFTQASRPLTKV